MRLVDGEFTVVVYRRGHKSHSNIRAIDYRTTTKEIIITNIYHEVLSYDNSIYESHIIIRDDE